MSDYDDLFGPSPEADATEPVASGNMGVEHGFAGQGDGSSLGLASDAEQSFDEEAFSYFNTSLDGDLPELPPDDTFINELNFINQLQQQPKPASHGKPPAYQGPSGSAEIRHQPSPTPGLSAQVPEIGVHDIEQWFADGELRTMDLDIGNVDFVNFEADTPYIDHPAQTILAFPQQFRIDPSFFLVNPYQDPPRFPAPVPHPLAQGFYGDHPDSLALDSEEMTRDGTSADDTAADYDTTMDDSTDANEVIYKRKYGRERPKIDPQKPWIRVSKKSGENARAAQSNKYDSLLHYGDPNNPLRIWRGARFTFQYDQWGGLKKPCYPSQQIREFLFDHPKTAHSHLTLWIQLQPPDSAKRYPTAQSSQCRFVECPDRQHGAKNSRLSRGVIWQGRIKVAFDERWHSQKTDGDPFLCAGFVHLYCMEQFLDFPEICRELDVKADGREFMPKEPAGKFGAALPEAVRTDAAAFIQDCKLNRLDPSYPQHENYTGGVKKPHHLTLTYALTSRKIASQSRSMYKTKSSRGLDESNELVHRGDEEKYLGARMRRKQEIGRARYERRKRKREDEEYDAEIAEKRRRMDATAPMLPAPPLRRQTRDDTPVASPAPAPEVIYEPPTAFHPPEIPASSQNFYSVGPEPAPEQHHGSISDSEIAAALASVNEVDSSDESESDAGQSNPGYSSDSGAIRHRGAPRPATMRVLLSDPRARERARNNLPNFLHDL